MLSIASRLSAIFAVIIVGVLFGSPLAVAKNIAVATSLECHDNPLLKGCSLKPTRSSAAGGDWVVPGEVVITPQQGMTHR